MDDYNLLIDKVKKELGIDLRLYKETQMKRRLTTLRDKRGFRDFSSYFDKLLEDKEMLHEFTDRITINVSEFYRNPKRWEVLQQKIMGELIGKGKKLSIWSAACSTGEEPYSLAIMLQSHFPDVPFEILATDLDENALSRAKQGVYAEQALRELPKGYKQSYFSQMETLFKVDDSLKEHITFKRHNLLSDKYPGNFDLIVCRNVLIYFTDEAKEQIYSKFSSSLKVGGMLFVGGTEQIFHPNKYDFQLADTFFYRRYR